MIKEWNSVLKESYLLFCLVVHLCVCVRLKFLRGKCIRYVLCTESFDKDIGSQTGIVSDSRENSLYSALWVAQALLRKG